MPPDYLITVLVNNGESVVQERLVRAKNEAAALKHVVADTITIRRAVTEDAMRIASEGGKIEPVGA